MQTRQKQNTLRGYQSFQHVFRDGRSITVGGLRCFFTARQASTGSIEIGFAVTREITSTVTRNRVKRLLRASWRQPDSQFMEEVKKSNFKIQAVFLFKHTASDKRLNVHRINELMDEVRKRILGNLKRAE